MAVKHSAPERKIDQERRQAALDALAPNSRRVYGDALKCWWFYALAAGVSDPWEPEPSQLRAYLLQLAEEGAGFSALRLTRAALVYYQRHTRRPPTASGPLISDTLDTLSRITSRGVGNELRALERGLVDIALCRVMSDAGLRLSD